jgi:hypothetical protein
VLAALPKPDVKLDAEFARLTYTHRQWTDGDMYYFFNESNKAESRVATIRGKGVAQEWDLATGEIHPLTGAVHEGPDVVKIPLVLAPYEAKVIVVGPLGKEVAAAEPSFATGDTLMALDGDWAVSLNGKDTTAALKPWEELGATGFAGPATYTRQFAAVATPKGKRVYLEIGDVHDYARVTLNGKDLGARAWAPYRWDVTAALKKGANDLKIEVNATPAGRGGPGGAPPAAVAAATPGPGLATAASAGAAGAGGQRRRQGAGAPGAAGAGAAPPPQIAAARPAAAPATSGLLGPVALVAH